MAEESKFALIDFTLVNEKKKEIIPLRNAEGANWKDLLTDYRGYIFLNMDKLNKETVFHELNHAAQRVLNYNNRSYAYNEATMEVETRMILFYAAFLDATPKEREDGEKMKEKFKKFYGISDLGTNAAFFGEGNIDLTLNRNYPMNTSKRSIYAISYAYFNNIVNSKENGDDETKNFNFLMDQLAKDLVNRAKYTFKPEDLNSDYYLFDKLTLPVK